MKIQTRLLLWAMFGQTILSAQSGAGLQFHSAFEQAAFGQSAEVILPLLLTVRPTADTVEWQRIDGQINGILKGLETEDIRHKKYKKASKIIFEKIHRGYLRQYQTYAEFQEIFETGVYNCVTASALYALVFEHFGIPYEIRQIPGHVYLVMDPAGEHIVVETTDPVGGVYSISKVQKERYVRTLGRMKMIPESEMRSVPAEQLYDHYVSGAEQRIDLRQLAGDLYFNNALKQMDAAANRRALAQLDKGQALFRQQLGSELRTLLLLTLVTEVRADDPESFLPLAELLEVPRFQEEARQEIARQIYLASERFLIKENRPEKYLAVYRYLHTHLPPAESELRTEIAKTHHLQLAKKADYQFDKALSAAHLDSAWQLVPQDLNLQSLISSFVMQQWGKTVQTGSDAADHLLDSLTTRYPFLADNPDIRELRLINTAVAIGQLFDADNPEKGFALLEEFNRQTASLPNGYGKAREMIGIVYGEISAYYVRLDQLDKARDWLRKGLELAPTDDTLLRKKEALEDYDLKYRKRN